MIVKFGGKPNEINVQTFLRTLSSLVIIIDEVNREVGSGQKVEINIKTPRPGSYIIDLGIIPIPIEPATDLIQNLDWKTTYYVVGTCVGLFTIANFFRGKKPDKVEKRDGNVKVKLKNSTAIFDNRTYNIHVNNGKIAEKLSEIFEEVNSNEAIESLEISDQDSSASFRADRKDFQELAAHDISLTGRKSRRVTQFATLRILKVVFDKKRKWEFVYRNNKISATISDEDFVAKWQSGSEKFSNGDSLEVVLEISQRYSEEAKAWMNKSYNIKEVRKHERRTFPGELGLS